MKLLTPFPYLEIFDRYVPQMKAMAERIDEFHVAYVSGQPREEWKQQFIFHKFMHHPYNPRKVGWTKRLFRMPRSFLRHLFSRNKAYNFVRKINVDLYYALSSFWPVELARYLAVKIRKPYAVRLRGNIQLELELKQPFHTKFFYLSSLLRNLKRSNLVIPISQRLRKYALYWGVPENRVSEPVGLGVDINHFQPVHVKQKKTLTLGYAGRLSQEKGIYRLIQLAKELPDVKFCLAGRKQCDFTRPNNVEYFGRLPHEEMPEFYNLVDIIMLPSFTEGFPNVILEAYACGKPIIATPEAFPPELRLFGLIKPFAEWEKAVKNHPELVKLGKGAREYVEKDYTWDMFGERIVAEFERAIVH